MRQEGAADALLLAGGEDVGVANQSYIPDLLKAHHAHQHLVLLACPERHAVLDCRAQFLSGHVRLGPAIGGDDTFIGARALIDDGPNRLEILFVTTADHRLPRVDPLDQCSCSWAMKWVTRSRKRFSMTSGLSASCSAHARRA